MKIHSGLTSGQVLQRLGKHGADVVISGETRQSGSVTVTLLAAGGALKGWRKKPCGPAKSGKYRVSLTRLPVGGPYRLRLECGREKVSVFPVFVGDVWVLAGQSNMQGLGNLEGAAKPHPLVRAFTMRREWQLARDPLHIPAESPDACHNGGQQCSREAAGLLRLGPKGTGLGIFFARELCRQTGVPQGLVCAAHGGTSMKQWEPAPQAESSTSLYGSMLASIQSTGQPVAGVLWYQGESDATQQAAGVYTKAMKDLVRAMRRDLGLPRLPWVIAQLARRFSDPGSPAWWNAIQDQQRLLPAQIRYLETVAAVDLPMDDHIHVGSLGLARLGVRMAMAMRWLVEGCGDRPPRLSPGAIHLRRSEIPGEWFADISFNHVHGSLVSSGEPSGFVITDADDNPVPISYRTSLRMNVARLHVQGDPSGKGLKFGYGLGLSPVCNVTDKRGYSLPVFGPIRDTPTAAWLPFVTRWAVTGVLPERNPLGQLTAQDLARVPHELQTVPTGLQGFVSEHDRWQGRSGQAYFAATLFLPESMTLNFLMGYDGPFALFLDRKRLFLDANGTNPATTDQSRKLARLVAGRHEIRVAMDTNGGAAWGFFLRFQRQDVTKKQIRTGDYIRPEYRLS